ncbi:hypothetical protein PV04_05139 [Phialophora macrospora]|uniref:Zn(2)-C6 fungal-type domain-containing protein n=1 Tax=Phialophora macrospora TaxID=1851006 RepID=A0A0D2GB12_9EURO|nr:hypothetical protein PV04_05139 [Phialophora macrospora]
MLPTTLPDSRSSVASQLSNSTASDQTSSPQQQESAPPLAPSSHQGRVRTGCLICRARKIKCDEQRPSCQKCIKSKKACVYRRVAPPAPTIPASASFDHQLHQNSPGTEHVVSQRRPVDEDRLSPGQLFTPGYNSNPGGPEHFSTLQAAAEPAAEPSASARVDASSCTSHEIGSFHAATNHVDSPSARVYNTSLDIFLVTTVDWLGTTALPHLSYSYFLEEVDCPFLSPFDSLNWKRIKIHLTQLAVHETSVAAAILALQSLYRALVNRMSMSNAITGYEAAVANLEVMVGNNAIEFDVILAVTLLLCLFEVTLPNEDRAAFCGFQQPFETRLKASLRSVQVSPISMRICTWLQLLHAASKRVGNCGLLPETMFHLLSDKIVQVSSLSLLDRYTHSAHAMYDIISAPLYDIYLEFQRVSNQIQGLSHYRRSRITPADQEEVAGIATRLKSRMSLLWEARPGPLRFQPAQLREDFSHAIAEPLITLAGLCTASYFVEVVALRRILGDPPFPSPESARPLRQIRDIVDGDWNVSHGGVLNPGYVRPLFIYAIEHIQREETQWAVSRLRQVKSPMSRSDFVADLAEALGEAERTEQRRVTTKYFCHRAFNVPVPLI